MPVLHKYTGKSGYYVLTSIQGNIITFQITNEGQERLKDAGIQPDQTFARALLLDLIRSGDAFTHGTGPGTIDSERDNLQLQFDFVDDPEPESMFPSCQNCSSLNDLHLVEIKKQGISLASIMCPKCRSEQSASIDTSVPLSLVSRGFLKRLFSKKAIEEVDDSVLSYQKLLDAEFENKWEELMKPKSTQERLFEKEDGKQSKLF